MTRRARADRFALVENPQAEAPVSRAKNEKQPEPLSWKNDPEDDRPVWIGLGTVIAFLLVLLAIGTTMRP